MRRPVPLAKVASDSRRAVYELIQKLAAEIAGREVQAPGALRTPASAAWRMGVSVPKPKTTSPGGTGSKAKEMPTARPPSKKAYWQDVVESINNPKRGFRQTKPLT
jgi:hypothetical protein